ncbi:MAG: DUF1127 domain-containing protein [Reyranella sp.]|uniref:DUF1127 domain-containing protein n=1 Tax=Reyranella sp. TaxID=1929291 RepID=UPI0012183A4F|nr:MAG: DUF1127 domain-containing protein [Reyranella sp.]TBR30175.1 MAG: DUF1127 domain-containing protein [Reyranella sp.]
MNTRSFVQSRPWRQASEGRASHIPGAIARAISLPFGRTIVSRLAHRSVLVVLGWWRTERGRRQRRRTIEELRALSDHTLRDIGVGRAGILHLDRDGLVPRDF